MTTKVLDTSKGRVEFSLVGTGIPILFAHGGHSSCNEMLFHKGFDSRLFCLITPSRPGYGKTPLSQITSPRDTAELFVALLDELKFEKAIVVGISAGGLSAIELASNFPDRLAKLVLISAVTKKWMPEHSKIYIMAKLLFNPYLERFTWGIFRFFYSLLPNVMAKIMFKELSDSNSEGITKEEIMELQGMIKLQRSNEGFSNDLDQNIAENVIGKISCPTLILHSSNDKSVGVEHAMHAHSNIQKSILKIYNNRWGHLLWLGWESNAVIEDTIQFIRNYHKAE